MDSLDEFAFICFVDEHLQYNNILFFIENIY